MATSSPSRFGCTPNDADWPARATITCFHFGRATRTLLLLLLVCISPEFFRAVHSQIAAPQGGEQAVLEPGKPLDREIVGGQVQTLQLSLSSGKFLRLVLEQKGGSVRMTLIDPKGIALAQADGALAPQVPLHVVTEVSGNYRVEVRSHGKEATTHGYRITLDELRDATEKDRRRLPALRAQWEGTGLRLQDTAQSLRQAVEKFHEALAIFKDVGDRQAEANLLNTLGYVHSRLGEQNKSLASYQQAAELYHVLGDERSEAAILYSIGSTYLHLGEYRQALDAYHRSLLLAQQRGDREMEAATLKAIAQAHYSLGEQTKASEFYNRALTLYQEARNQQGEAETLLGLGRAYGAMDEGKQAIESYHHAIELYRALGDQDGEAQALTGIGQVHASRSEHQQAVACYKRALPLLSAAGNRDGEALTRTYIGELHYTLNEYQQAQEAYLAALEFYRSVGSRDGEAALLNSLGHVYTALGDQEKAIGLYRQAMAMYQATNNPSAQAAVLNNLAVAYLSSDEHRQALESLRQALALQPSVGNRRSETSILNNLGSTHTALGEYSQALELFTQALALSRETGNRRSEASILNNTGRTYLALGDYDKAFNYLNDSLALQRAIRDRKREAQSLFHLARVHRARGNLGDALSASEAAIRIAESLRAVVNEPLLRASHFASLQQFYDLHIDLLMQLHKQRPSAGLQAAALEVSERRRARSLLDLLAEARADIRQGIEPALLERERALGKLLDAKAERQTQLLNGKAAPEKIDAIAKEIESVVTQHRQMQAEIRAASPRYAALTEPQPIAVRAIQEQLLDADTVLLEYALGDERSYLWVVSATSITGHQLPKREEIEAAAQRFYELAKSDTEQPELEAAAASLSRMLLSPAADRLPAKRLLIVADGILHYVPFAALPAPQTRRDSSDLRVAASLRPRVGAVPLIANHEIVLLPSASMLAEMRRESAGRQMTARTVAVFADPVFNSDDPRLKRTGKAAATATATATLPERSELQRALRDVGMSGDPDRFPRLPFSRHEAEAIASFVPAGEAMKALDFQASRNTVINTQLSRYRVLHFATHGLLNNRHPELSGIVLSLYDDSGQLQNGFLRLHEIFNLKLPAELVVLSACQTGMGKQIRGEGLIGLTRGFMYAGSERVVASLWKVDDEATAELMKRFYRQMFERKLRPAAALRQAQVEMWKQPRWRAPYYWAAFVLQGEWR